MCWKCIGIEKNLLWLNFAFEAETGSGGDITEQLCAETIETVGFIGWFFSLAFPELSGVINAGTKEAEKLIQVGCATAELVEKGVEIVNNDS